MIVNYKDLTTLWHKSASHMLMATRDELDAVSALDTMIYDNVLSCDSMAFDFDMGRDLWLTKARFTILQRDYLDLMELEAFLTRCKEIGLVEAKRGVITQMFCKSHARARKRYRWGNCMMAFTYRGGTHHTHERPVLTLHSRVSYIAYIGGLDLALAHVLAREIAQRIGCGAEDIAFRWVVDSLQFHGFKSLPYLFRLGLEPVLEAQGRYPSKYHPTLKLVRKWWEQMVMKYEMEVPLEDEKYGPLKRIRMRYEQYRREDFMTSVPIQDLSFTPLRQRG